VKNANPVSRRLTWLGLLVAVALSPACDDGKSVPPTAAKTVAHFFPIRVGARTVRMQLAVLPGEMQQGLMGRRDFGRDDGMLFVYARSQPVSFWMRNTPTPLDIGFFNAEGTLLEIYAMYPFDENSVRSRSQAVQFALEMNQGWFRENGVQPGAKLDLKAMAAALKERDFEPRKFGLAE
jgi:uncharacterized membrane protein (UPF0127 family)